MVGWRGVAWCDGGCGMVYGWVWHGVWVGVAWCMGGCGMVGSWCDVCGCDMVGWRGMMSGGDMV